MTRPAIFSIPLMLAVVLAVAPVPLHAQTPSIQPTVLPDTVIGANYNVSLSVANPQCSLYNWTLLSGGTPPPGLSLNAITAASTTVSGTVGNPSADLYSFSIQAGATCDGYDVYQTYTMRVLAIKDSSFPVGEGLVGRSYSHVFSAWGLTPVGNGGGATSWSAAGLPPGLSMVAATGEISGTPTTAGTFNGSVTVSTDGGARTATRGVTIVIYAPLAFVNPASLPPATVGVPYSVSIQLTGGVPPVSDGQPSAPSAFGLSYNPNTRTLSGTPTATGTYTMTLYAFDSWENSVNRTFTVLISQPPGIITTASLPDGIIQVPYSATLTSSGFFTSPTWSVQGLPPGLALNPSTGVISGTPTATGTFNATFNASTAIQTSQPKTLPIVVKQPYGIITTASLPDGTVQVPYSATLTSSVFLTPPTWSATGLPSGLALNPSTGVISGSPTVAGSFYVTFNASTQIQTSQPKTLLITIHQPNGIITTTSLPDGSAQVPYSATLTSSGFFTPPTWSATGLPPGLTINPSTGEVSGLPMANGSFGVTFNASTENQSSQPKTLMITIGARALDFTPGVLPNGVLGTFYSSAFTATGGDGTYVFVPVPGSALPPGLALSANGVVSGTPSQAGTFKFAVRVTSGQAVTEKAVQITVDAAPMVLTPSALAAGYTGEPYSQTFVASGGTAPYVFQFGQTSNVPPGLTLSAGGVLSGTPTTAGTFAVNIQVTDANQRSLQRDYTVVVSSRGTIVTTTLPDATQGEPYRTVIEVAGGTGPFVFDIPVGSLPPGLTLNGSGEVTGTPSAPGTYPVTVRATDTNQKATTRELVLVVFGIILVGPETAPNAALLKDYSVQLTATGGKPPFTWQVTNGTLPAGIVLTNGVLHGAATGAGSFTFDVTATDQRQRTASKRYTIIVAEGPSIQLDGTVPDGLVGVSYTAEFTSKGGLAPFRWSVQGQLPPGLSLGAADGTITGVPTTVGAFDFTLRVEDAAGLAATAPFRITVVLGTVPKATITGISGVSGPSSQITFGITTEAPFPAPLDGAVALAFQPDSGADDPAVLFSNGGRLMPFTVPAGATTANFPVGRSAVQTGTVAGLVTMTASFSFNGTDVTPKPAPVSTLRIEPAAPVITRMDAARTATGFTLTIFGYTTARQVTQARVTLTPTSGFTLAGTQFTVDVGTLFSAYYASAASAPFGSQFTLVLPFTLSDPLGVASVSVTLVNSIGSSAPSAATF